jgi:phage/plasmid-like protein (TIGR03299 family)
MSHAVEVSEFEAAFASRKVPAWHQLGTVFEDDVTTNEMLELAHLDNWDVHLRPVYVEGVDQARYAKQSFATVRTNPFDQELDVLGVVGQRYNPFQNEDLLGFGDNLLDGGGRWETAGSIKDGRQIFASLAMPNGITLDPNGSADRIDNYLLLHTSHDGSISVVAANTPVRVVCANTLNFALRKVKQSFKIRHTQTMDGKIAAAREALGISFDYMDVFEAEAQALIQTEMDRADFTKLVTDLYPKPDKDKKAGVTRWENKVDALGDIFTGQDENQSNLNILGTAWAGLNTLTEYGQWYRNPRGGNAESTLVAGSGLDPVANAERNRQRKAVLSYAGL